MTDDLPLAADLRLVFSQIANAKRSEQGFRLERCPDQYVGVIGEFVGATDFSVRTDVRQELGRAPAILLVLESPHQAEFEGHSVGPARGPTGRKIIRWITQVAGLSDCASFGLVLMNAVQFQCSLGLPTSMYRDEVFRQMWKGGGREDFKRRLLSVYQPGDVVVNSCTRGALKGGCKPLRDLVQIAIDDAELGCRVLRRTHPFSWHSRMHRDYEWNLVGTEQP